MNAPQPNCFECRHHFITHEPARIGEQRVRFIRLPESAGAYAAALYGALREADALEPELILIERPHGSGGLWTAIHDRLERATSTDDPGRGSHPRAPHP